METTTPHNGAAPYGTGAPVRRLTRKNGSLSGVAGGFADYAGIDPTLVRLGLVAGTILTFPLVPIAYVAAWAIMPEDTTDGAAAGPMATTQPPAPAPHTPPPPRPGDSAWNPVPPTAHQDAAVAMAMARAEVEAADRTAPLGPVAPAPLASPSAGDTPPSDGRNA